MLFFFSICFYISSPLTFNLSFLVLILLPCLHHYFHICFLRRRARGAFLIISLFQVSVISFDCVQAYPFLPVILSMQRKQENNCLFEVSSKYFSVGWSRGYNSYAVVHTASVNNPESIKNKKLSIPFITYASSTQNMYELPLSCIPAVYTYEYLENLSIMCLETYQMKTSRRQFNYGYSGSKKASHVKLTRCEGGKDGTGEELLWPLTLFRFLWSLRRRITLRREKREGKEGEHHHLDTCHEG